MASSFILTVRLRRIILALIVAAGLILRLAGGLLVREKIVQGDSALYQNYAELITERRALPSEFAHPPGYPLFLSAVKKLAGGAAPVVPTAQAFISAAAILLVYLLAKKIFRVESAALFAAAIVAVDPFLVYFSAQVASETLFCAFLYGSIYLLHEKLSSDDKPVSLALAAGVLAGAALLTRAAVSGFVALIPVSLFFYGFSRKKAVALAVFFAIVAVMMYPWILRNQKVYGRFVPLTVQAGWNMWEASCPAPYDAAAMADWIQEMKTESEGMSPTETDDYFKRKFWSAATASPSGFLKAGLMRFARFWRLYPYDPYPAGHKIISVLFFGPLLILAAAGIVLAALAGNRQAALLYILAASSAVGAFLFCPAVRYRLYLHPAMAIFAAYAVTVFLNKNKNAGA